MGTTYVAANPTEPEIEVILDPILLNRLTLREPGAWWTRTIRL
jgi:hypothetical protein